MITKQMSFDLLPVVSKILSDCEERLSMIIGKRIKLELVNTDGEINDAKIQTLVCNEFGVSWGEILDKTRVSHIVDARHTYWWLAYVWLKANYSQIGKDFDKDHTSIMHGVRRIRAMIETSDPIATKVKSIEKKLVA